MILNKTGYSYQDLTIVPEQITDINSRSECCPFDDGMLPIFTAPMSTIVNEKNINIWRYNKITPIIPRNIEFNTRLDKCKLGIWVAFSLSEFTDIFVKNIKDYIDINSINEDDTYRVCLDLANGHMKSLYEVINKAKELSRNHGYTLEVMTGNIANPETYKWICEHAEVDYIRLSIGTGANCITSTQTSVHYPIATLIDECHTIKSKIKYIDGRWQEFIYEYEEGEEDEDDYNPCIYYKSCPKIIADGGIRGYADVIKALGLGADYVMIGSLFTGLLESAAPLNIECYNSHYKYMFNTHTGEINDGVKWFGWGIWDNNIVKDNTIINDVKELEICKRNFIHDMKDIIKESYGMSTKKAQKLINPNATPKTSEGCTKYIKVKETVAQWSDNMISYFKSAMSYTNKRSLGEFKGKVKFIPNSSCAILAVNK